METHNKVLCNTETEFHCGSKPRLCDPLLPASCVCVCVCVCGVCVCVCGVCVLCVSCVCVVCVCVCVLGVVGEGGKGRGSLMSRLAFTTGWEKSSEIRLFSVPVFSLSSVPSPLVILWYPYLS